MADKLDYKKAYKDLYQPGRAPALVRVPPMLMLLTDGVGEPGGAEYQAALSALYALSFTIKMSKMSGLQPEGYFEYVVPPLEGFWWSEGGALDLDSPRSTWLWTSAIRQPEFVTPEVFRWAVEECRRKKPEVDVGRLRLETVEEGLCVQTLHLGPYSEEAATLAELRRFIAENRLRDCCGDRRKHHEIYLSDPRRVAPERRKTVLRLPVEPA